MKKIMSSLMLLSVLSCNKNITPTENDKIVIDPLITKATETNFEKGDKIGLCISRDSGDFATNKEMTYDGAVFTGELKWYTEGSQESNFVAYYPYSATGVPTTFSVSPDQAAQGSSSSDLMSAIKNDVTPVSKVSMQFKHLLTRIIVELDNQAGATVKKVTLDGTVTSADVDIVAGTVTAKVADPTAISAFALTPDARYCAVVIPQTAAFKVSVELSNGAVLTKKLVETTLKQGGQYTVKMVVTAKDMDISISDEIENWSDEGELLESEISFHEYDTYFEYDGEKYNIATLADGNKWMTENLRVCEGLELPSPSTDPVKDVNASVFYPYSVTNNLATALTDAESIKKFGLLYTAKAIFGKEFTRENVHDFNGAKGICPKGWHVPTRAEYLNLCGNSNKDDSGKEITTVIKDNAIFYDSAMGAGTVTKFTDGGWNFICSGSVANGKYSTITITADKSPAPSWTGSLGMNYYWSSTGYLNPNSDTAKPSLFALMTTFTSAAKGKVSLAYCNTAFAAPLRCVKDK